MTLGYCYKEMPNGGLAAQQYEIAEGLDPKNPLIKFMLAKVYKAAKLPDRFVEYCDKAIALQPNYTLALRAKAEHYYFSRKWEMALKAYQDLVTNGNNVTVDDEAILANCLFINKKYKECADLVEKIIKKDGSKTYLRRLLGYCYHDTGEFQKGFDVMKEYFIKVSPEKVIASDHLYYGRLMLKTKGDSTAAIESLKKGIILDSTAWAVNKEIAELQYTRKANNEAVKHWKMYLDSVAKQEPTDLYKYGLAQYFDRTDSTRFEKSEKIFVKVAELVPKATLGWIWAAKSAKNLDVTPEQITANPELAKQYGRALMYYEKFVEVATDKEKNKRDLLEAYNYISYCYLVKLDAEKFNAVTAKWLELETDPAKQEYIREMQASFGKDIPAPAPGQTPPAGGGKG
jgi:tetratricopeptide (TPR) repeat protein